MNFFDATSYVFHNFKEYVKVFLTEMIVAIIMILLGYVPFFGWILNILLAYYGIFIVPVGVYKVFKEGSITISELLNSTYDVAIHPGKTFSQIMKIAAVVLSMIIVDIFLFFIFFMQFIGSLDTHELYAVTEFLFSFLLIIFITLIYYVFLVKMNQDLFYLILDNLIDKDNFYETYKPQFRWDFLWMLIPVINIFAQYSLSVKFLNKAQEKGFETDDIKIDDTNKEVENTDD